MDPFPPTMPTWLRWLQRTGGGTTAAAVLEAVSPLATVGAQVLYLLHPILGSTPNVTPTARLFEDPARLAQLIEDLERLEAER